MNASASSLRLLVAQDIGITSIQDGKGGASEELSARSAELDLSGRVSLSEPSKVYKRLLLWAVRDN